MKARTAVTRTLLVIVLVFLFHGFPPGVSASLLPGHLYSAWEMAGSMPAQLKGAVERYRDVYMAGASGHDIAYWASYVPGSDAGAMFHEEKTGELNLALIRRAKEGTDRDRAFAAGWLTHWITDLFIHTLVDIYGGNYITGEKRHVQLELVESMHVSKGRKFDLGRFSLTEEHVPIPLLTRACRDVFPEEEAYRDTVTRSWVEGKLTTFYSDPQFYGMLRTGTSIMGNALECLKEAGAQGRVPAAATRNWDGSSVRTARSRAPKTTGM